MRRPRMLEELLKSLQCLAPPESSELHLVVVDNDAERTAESIVRQSLENLDKFRVHYVPEQVPGIPIARNRALSEALALDCDMLAFVDDDETVDPRWLVELTTARQERGLQLVGGPVRTKEWSDIRDLSAWQRSLLRGVKFRYIKKENAAARRLRKGREDSIVIVTNNWAIDGSWLKASQLKFDESLRFSGGSDAAFFKRAKQLGIRSGWCPAAVVFEWIPASRVSFSYQLRRAQAQSISSFHRKYGAGLRAAPGVLVSVVLKGFGCLACLFALPFGGGRAMIQLARSSGWISGRVQALFGRRSGFYGSDNS